MSKRERRFFCSKCGLATGKAGLRKLVKRGACTRLLLLHEEPGAGTSSSSMYVDRPVPVFKSVVSHTTSVAQPIIVGCGELHTSHSITKKRGIFWCWRCGKYATSAPRQLTLPCPGRPNAGGIDCLRRVRAGKTPRAGLDWPEPG